MTNQTTAPTPRKYFRKAPILLSKSEAAIIDILHRNRLVSRAEITAITCWSKAKTSHEVNGVIAKGYVIEVGDGVSQGGRKPRLLQINDKLGFVVGIDIGATSIEIVLADTAGTILQRVAEAADVRQSAEIVLGRCKELALEMAVKQNIHPEQILGIGVGVPGPVNFTRGMLVAPPLIPDWEEYPIRDYFTKTFTSSHVSVDNDVNIMALGEQNANKTKEIENFLMIKIGTGIGCGIMASKKIHRGSEGSAGDIGHICVDKNGPVCLCGNRGCLEAMAAGPAIAQRAMQAARDGKSELLKKMMEANEGVLTPEDVNAACREGDEAALDIIRSSGQMIGEVLAGLVNFFNPSHIFIGGGIANFGNHLLIAIKRTVLRRSLPLATQNLTINFSRTGADSGILGAITLAREYIFTVENDQCLSL
jgi:glucokinase-like ROK family protein